MGSLCSLVLLAAILLLLVLNIRANKGAAT